MRKMMLSIHTFSESTKYICIIIGIALMLNVFALIYFSNNSKTKIIIKLFSIFLFFYALIINFIETKKLIINTSENPEEYSAIRFNALFSYFLCALLLYLVIYISYSLLY
jgi:uncharacterized membrane protein